MDADEKNRYVLEVVAERLRENPDFHGKVVLNCKDGRIVHHSVERSYLTDRLLEENGDGSD